MKTPDLRRMGYYWVPAIVWMAAIFAMSSLTREQVEAPARELPFFINDVTAHFGEYGVLAVLLYRLLASYRVKPIWRIWLGVIVLATTYAASDELHQAFVPGRHPSTADMANDALGAVAGLVLANAAAVVRQRLR